VPRRGAGTLTADRILLNARSARRLWRFADPAERQRYAVHRAGQFRHLRGPSVPRRADPGAVHPDQPDPHTDDGHLVAYLAEDSEYDDEQARLAAIQRLLVIAGYDAAPIDGVDGPKTQTALAAFLKSRGLSADLVQSPKFFATMIDAVQSPSSVGLTWCNDTPHRIMAAVGTDDGKTVISRGWYRIDPGQMPASRRVRPATADFQFRRGGGR
jgi:hypothetical protein